ncbi:MAG TPA: hypothetical protein VIN40_02645 [Candidatus Tyrphobacter sp.]
MGRNSDVTQGGVTFDELGLIRNGAILTEGDRIVALGPEKDIARKVPPDAVELDVRDCVVVPGFIDAHSHPLFAGDREADFDARIRGESPPQGMLHTVRLTREALRDPAEFYEAIVGPRLRMMLAHGTTALEVKTGYALTVDGEMALLDLIAAHRNDPDTPRLVSTFLGAHMVPPEFDSADHYLDVLVADALPEVRGHGAAYADIFCEPGFFTVEQSRRYLIEAKRHGLLARIHVDEMSPGGGAVMAASLGVEAMDHCNFLSPAQALDVAHSTIVVSCPATIAFLEIPKRPPAREILDVGGAIALASDFNPGTSPCFNLQTVAYYGRKLLGLTAAEALYGVTRAAARSTHASSQGGLGALWAGDCFADFVALEMDDPREFGWYFGGNMAKLVVKGGAVVGVTR